jgi:TPR repeat protein
MPDDRTSSEYQQVEAKGQTPETETLEQLRQLAEGGYPAAQNDLGWMYQNGRGVPQNDRKAIKWYRKAAESGNLAKAQDNLGWMYQHGRGVPQNDEEAIKWYRKAAEGGYSAAQDNLDWMYQNGRDVKQT